MTKHKHGILLQKSTPNYSSLSNGSTLLTFSRCAAKGNLGGSSITRSRLFIWQFSYPYTQTQFHGDSYSGIKIILTTRPRTGDLWGLFKPFISTLLDLLSAEKVNLGGSPITRSRWFVSQFSYPYPQTQFHENSYSGIKIILITHSRTGDLWGSFK